MSNEILNFLVQKDIHDPYIFMAALNTATKTIESQLQSRSFQAMIKGSIANILNPPNTTKG